MKKHLTSFMAAAVILSCASSAFAGVETKSTELTPVAASASSTQTSSASQKLKNDVKTIGKDVKSGAEKTGDAIKSDAKKIDNKMKETGKAIETDTKKGIDKFKNDMDKNK